MIQQLETALSAQVNEKEKLQAELEANKQDSILSFEEASIASNLMSERKLLRHKEMRTFAMKWLCKQGFIVPNKVVLPNKKRADAIGYNEEKIVVIEVKSSRVDYKQDTKWSEYLPYCNEFYFFLNFYVSNQAEKQVSFLEEHGRTLRIVQNAKLHHQCEHRNEIQ